jgi:phosphodiesterase/alkaline phosphatase D-like protein
VDLGSLLLPDPRLARRFSLSADDWGGFPNRRAKLLAALADVDGVVAVTGDSHSFFASGLGLAEPSAVVEFVCGAISSTTYRSALERGVGGVPSVAMLAPIAGRLIQQQNPAVAFQNVEDNGFAFLVASEAQLQVSFYQIPHARLSDAMQDADADAIAELFKTDTFRVRRGSSSIERKLEGAKYETWDAETRRWG